MANKYPLTLNAGGTGLEEAQIGDVLLHEGNFDLTGRLSASNLYLAKPIQSPIDNVTTFAEILVDPDTGVASPTDPFGGVQAFNSLDAALTFCNKVMGLPRGAQIKVKLTAGKTYTLAADVNLVNGVKIYAPANATIAASGAIKTIFTAGTTSFENVTLNNVKLYATAFTVLVLSTAVFGGALWARVDSVIYAYAATISTLNAITIPRGSIVLLTSLMEAGGSITLSDGDFYVYKNSYLQLNGNLTLSAGWLRMEDSKGSITGNFVGNNSGGNYNIAIYGSKLAIAGTVTAVCQNASCIINSTGSVLGIYNSVDLTNADGNELYTVDSSTTILAAVTHVFKGPSGTNVLIVDRNSMLYCLNSPNFAVTQANRLITAQFGSFLGLNGSVTSGNIATAIPPINTVGNSNSFISR